MPDTSQVGDSSTWQGALVLLVSGLGAIAVAIGDRLGKRAKEESPVAYGPESAGAVMGLIESTVQRKIESDTRRTADNVAEATEVLVKILDTVARVERLVSEFIDDNEERSDRKDREESEKRIREVEAENARMRIMIDSLKGSAGPYTTRPRD